MTQQNDTESGKKISANTEPPVQSPLPFAVRIKRLNITAIGILILGIVGVFLNVVSTPGRFPVISMFIAAIGIILTVSVSTKFLTGAHHEK